MIRTTALVLAFVAASGPASAQVLSGGADLSCPHNRNPTVKKPATIAGLIATVLSYGSGAGNTRAIHYQTECSVDGRHHGIFLLFSRDRDGAANSVGVTLSTAESHDGKRFGASFKTDATGKLLGASSNIGPENRTVVSPMDIKSESVKKLFARELDFVLKGSTQLPFKGKRAGSYLEWYEPWQAH